jgi:hypothetical protein
MLNLITNKLIIYHDSLLFCYRKPSGPSKALKLGGKSRDVEFFVDQLKSEGEKVASLNQTTNSVINKSTSQASTTPLPNTEK